MYVSVYLSVSLRNFYPFLYCSYLENMMKQFFYEDIIYKDIVDIIFKSAE